MADVMLAEKWSDEDPSGWWISEKLDGVRALWKGGEFVSRGDNTFACPEWFKKKMPTGCVLDGELWAGRRQFQKTVGIVKSSVRAKEWEFITYMVFDVLVEGGKPVEHRPFEERLASIRTVCATGANVLEPVPMQKCKGRDHLQELLTEIESRGGEGLMLRRPGSLYEHRRSKGLLKVKTFHDDEAIVVGHETGKGRLSSMCGALLCETPDKRRFKVGSGLSDAQRSNPPKVGTVITYRYQELTNNNIPRFPTLAGERVDLVWRSICASYVPPGKRIETALRKTHSVLFSDALASAPASASAASSGASAASSGAAPATATPAAAVAPLPPRIKRRLSDEDVAQRAVAVEDCEDLTADEPELPPAKKARTSVVDKRSVCVYGSKCYRSNPEHFVEFAHPWLDAENDDPMFAAPLAAASASASAVTPSAALSFTPGSLLPPAAASSATPGPVAPLAATSTPTVFLAPRVATSASTAIFAAPAPAAITSIASRLLDASSVAAFVLPASLPPTPRSPSAAARLLGTATPSTDTRVVALRSLLGSLASDALELAERVHFQHLLDLLNAGPAAMTSLLPPFPPPDGPPPLSMIGSMRPPAPEQCAPASVVVAPVEPETLLASPEEVAAVVATAPVGVAADVRKIMDLGFHEADAVEALREKGEIEAAIEWLLDRPIGL